MEISNNSTLTIKVEEKIIFHVPIEFGINNSLIKISGIDNNSYPINIYFREGQKLKLNNSKDTITLSLGGNIL